MATSSRIVGYIEDEDLVRALSIVGYSEDEDLLNIYPYDEGIND